MKRAKKVIFFILILIIAIVVAFFVGRQVGLNTDISTTTTTIEEVTVELRTITQTLTASGEVESAETEQLSLSTSKYFKTLCVEEDDTVEEGDNIVKYKDGTYLTAPYDCVIVSCSVPSTGEICTSDNYIEIESVEDLQLNISITESEIGEVSVGDAVEIVLTADDSKTYEGTIDKIDSVGSYSSSGTTFSAVIGFENDGYVKLGMSASCTITLEEKEDIVACPIDAVQIEDDYKYVIVVKGDGSTENVEVETGISDDEYVEITSGLSEGDVVQVITTTTQSTSRSTTSSDEESSSGFGGKGQMDSGSGDMDFSQRGQGGSSGEMPSMPSN